MIAYYNLMRHKDEQKQEAIFQATIQLLNEVGFSELSMSKIAKKANVSVATIYVYFENKEDLLSKLYLMVKQKLSVKMLIGLDQTTSVKTGFELVLRNYIGFVLRNKDYFLFIEQFTNSPLIQKFCIDESASLFKSVFLLFEQGKKDKLFKQVHTNILITYSCMPIVELAKEHFRGELELTAEMITELINMSWDAIKL
jgi:AcrR family transcriptional regulator